MNDDKDKDKSIVAADPAKGFFVSMLIKDITLRDAIGDLVDNAVDAIKKRVESDDLTGYEIDVKLGKTYFSISDNGYGMEAEIARTTAFNFGKSDKHELISNSIGQFGIGMKRAFFKLGNIIDVKSISPTSKFEIEIDVKEWLRDKNFWQYQFKDGTLKEKIKNPPSKTGFYVKITELSNDSVLSFGDKNFINQLINEIQYEHLLNINKGLTIKINDFKLNPTSIDLVFDDNIKPTYWEKIGNEEKVRVIAGISTKDDEDGGWYIFCNDRLIIAKNKTDETVWTGSKGDGVSLWHSQYHRFRGYVFFEAKDSSKLPWNTTKTGMDLDSPYYKEVRQQMVAMTKQVMGLMDKLKSEKEQDNPEENQKLNKAVEESLIKPLSVLQALEKSQTLSNKFVYPERLFNPVKKKDNTKISYQVPTEKFNKVKEYIKKSSPKDIGLFTFDYYYENEV
ncbi:ATP-binding protein [Sphingobacterium sp.]|uniref:ATP-binding protein n=1 Tax=Sphingobacterium sp. TaxID=341027 RepID=UPI002897E617|nr:ATP-binding protein [Sphingobacterium sp.]